MCRRHLSRCPRAARCSHFASNSTCRISDTRKVYRGAESYNRWYRIHRCADNSLQFCESSHQLLTWRPVYQPLGAHKGLSVQLKSSNLQVQCTETRQLHTTVPQYASCQMLLSEMPWSQQYTVFGPYGRPRVQVSLPASMPSGKCLPAFSSS